MQNNSSIPQTIQPLYDCLKSHEEKLGLEIGEMYVDFPVYKELDADILVAQTMVISPRHGVLLFKVSQHTDEASFESELPDSIDKINKLYSTVFSRILRNEKLKTGRQSIKVSISTIIYAPYISNPQASYSKDDVLVVYTQSQLVDCIKSIQNNTDALNENGYKELLSSIEGSKGLIVPNKRETSSDHSKASAANQAEQEIMLFDLKQKMAYLTPITGVSRIRGLAGSGKTVILCMKAALLHLREPEAKILYTFYTKSLYQHVRRLITRFYRQYNDQDPDWDMIQVRHAWGSTSMEGVYSQACDTNGVYKLSYADARIRNISDPFDAVCNDFIVKAPNPEKTYDYVLIDEGQDFPTSFIRMCLSLVKENRILFAYDDLQTIFQNHAPTAAEIFGTEQNGQPRVNSFSEDSVLPKCYRNPREILVVAHALGFGIYAKSISQMIESEEYWNDIGYQIKSGKLEEGVDVEIFRPEENSLKAISERYEINDIVRCSVSSTFAEEVGEVCKCINDDIKGQNLHPEDIMVLSADDRNSKVYLNSIEKSLAINYSIMSNNVHADKFSVGNFQEKDRVTLSTIHKAKGNEAYSVYIVGIDGLIPAQKNYRSRNLFFTAMTRAKGWVRISGLGETAQLWVNEVQESLKHFPYLKFRYPSKSDIKLMQRDMAESAIKENRRKRLIDQLLQEMTPEEAKMFIEQRMIPKA